MPDAKQEQDLKRLNELNDMQKKQQQLTDQQKEEFNALKQKYAEIIKRDSEEAQSSTPQEYVTPTPVQITPNLKKLVEEYNKNHKPAIDLNAAGKEIVFVFKNKEEALDFFRSQVKNGPFQVYNRESDHCIYSDGNTLVHGKLAEVDAYKKNPEAFNIGNDGALQKKGPAFKLEPPPKSKELDVPTDEVKSSNTKR